MSAFKKLNIQSCTYLADVQIFLHQYFATYFATYFDRVQNLRIRWAIVQNCWGFIDKHWKSILVIFTVNHFVYYVLIVYLVVNSKECTINLSSLNISLIKSDRSKYHITVPSLKCITLHRSSRMGRFSFWEK